MNYNLKKTISLYLISFLNINTFLFILCLFPFIALSQQNNSYEINHKIEFITVLNKGGYEKKLLSKGKVGDLPTQIKLFYNNIEKTDSLEVKYRVSQGSTNILRPDQIIDQEETDYNILGFRSKLINLKSNVLFEYACKVSSNDLFTLTSLDFFSESKTDTFTYVINIPNDFHLIFKPFNIEKDGLVFSMDSLSNSYGVSYTFKGFHSTSIENKGQTKQTINKKNNFPQIKICVVPNKYKVNLNSFLNDSYQKIVKPTTKLNQESLLFFESLFDKMQHGDSFVINLYELIKTKITLVNQRDFSKYPYPQDVNTTLSSKRGASKDIANLLCETYKHFGFDAHLVFIPSRKIADDLDFPGLNSVNNLICAIKLNNKWVYINPEEPFFGINIPPLAIQNKHVFIINNKGGEIQLVEKVKPEKQKIDFSLDLLYEEFFESLSGTYSFSDNYFTTNTKNINLENENLATSENDTLRALEEFSQGLNFLNYYDKKNKNFLVLNGDISLPRKFIIKLGKRNYFSIKFLPFPHNLSKNIIEEDFVLLLNQHNNFNFKINFLNPVKLFEELHANFNENGLIFSMDIIQAANKEIEIKYNYQFEDFPDKEKQFKTYNKLNNYMSDAITKLIAFDSITE